MNFRERQESVSVSAVFNEDGLQSWFDPGDFRQVNVSDYLLLIARFKVEHLDFATVQNHNSCFFFVNGIDKQISCHFSLSDRCRGPASSAGSPGIPMFGVRKRSPH